jgi:putative colanic acid biosynthesis acetyltransferase WcaF
LWAFAYVIFFRLSPRVLYGWRNWLLRRFGAKIGTGAKVMPSAKVWAPWNLILGDFSCISHDVDCYSVDRITIGCHVTISQYSYLCTASHDVASRDMKLISSPIHIHDGVWVCAGAFVGMGLHLGEGAVVGAMSVVTKDVAPWSIVAGNPARKIGERQLQDQHAKL